MHALLAVLVGVDHDLAVWVLLLGDLIAVGSVPSVLRRRRGRPTAALAWLAALFAAPFLGAALWWLLARTHVLTRRPSPSTTTSRCSVARTWMNAA